ncbi:MAG: HU family DNA-binding protein [Clostridium sp.]|uniref:HU family DNA-binding protein n=1 Tax=Clostridium sp. TaxID=1506 RepID=UPI0025C6ADBB|nr:HU family DNA-binding protein [Clostridium sp.]MCE5220095.1 HU family DNA-binding protein [Clostridium sp.]
MNKTQFIEEYTKVANKTKKESGIEVDTFLKTLQQALITDGKVQFMDNWSVEVVPTLARMGHNPATGEEIRIPEGKKIRFKPSKTLKKLVNG